MDLYNQVHGERFIQDITIKPKSRNGLLPPRGRERYIGVGKGGEAAEVGGDHGVDERVDKLLASKSILTNQARKGDGEMLQSSGLLLLDEVILAHEV
jgi:hypothetical protein